MSDVRTAARNWITQDPDPETRAELQALLDAGDDSSIQERFSGRLLFGTAGIRGVLGGGPMRMNRVVVSQVSSGLAAYVLEHVDGAASRGVVIGHDARKNSRVFAEDAAEIFLGAGFKVYLFEQPVPTPTTAFAVSKLGAATGVMVTASHNPPDYNGYKVYWENGAQIISPHDEGIQTYIEKVSDIREISRGAQGDARKSGALLDLGNEIEQQYIDGVLGLRANPEVAGRDRLTIAYTPLHGVGGRFVAETLKRSGYTDVHVEPSQAEPDGGFPTVAFPNPEEAGAMDRVLELARAQGADVVVANDPDADRLAVALPHGDGYRMLTGDQVGVLLADYLLSEGPQDKRLVATTVVSSEMLGVMAAALGIEFRRTLTGFKWIANTAIRERAATGARLVMGYEEALGYTIGELVRDKDGVSAILLFCELAAVAKSRGTNVRARLDELYRRYGLYLTRQVSLTMPGQAGLETIAALMRQSRANPPTQIGDYAVVATDDLLERPPGEPKANVLVFSLEGGGRVLLRPSGTEPKLKSYYELCEPVADGEEIASVESRATKKLDALATAHQALLAAAQ